MTAAPKAAEMQGGSNGADELLVLAARARESRRRWWWGSRYKDRRRGAWCYLCDRWIATWSSRWPITTQAIIEIRLHRTEHVQGRLDTPAQESTER